MKKILVIVLICGLLCLPASGRAGFEIHFLDVGQGDCTIVLCEGESMVVDGGPASRSDYVYSYIRDTLRLTHIDYVISTHPHADHVGGLAAVLNAAPADLLLTPVLDWDSEGFRSMMKYAELSGTPVSVPRAGDTLRLGSAVVTVLCCWPEAVRYGRVNDASIVLRIDYGRTSFLIAGDAEEWAEEIMLQDGAELKADVLRVAHHGSAYSSMKEFLVAVRPEYAVISVGKNNKYGHPHRETLERLAGIGSRIIRTDRSGTIRMESDGEEIRIG